MDGKAVRFRSPYDARAAGIIIIAWRSVQEVYPPGRRTHLGRRTFRPGFAVSERQVVFWN